MQLMVAVIFLAHSVVALNKKLPGKSSFQDAPAHPWSTWTKNGYLLHESKEHTRSKIDGQQKSESVENVNKEPLHVEEKAWVENACLKVRSGPSCDGVFRRYHEEYSMDGDIILAGLFPVHLGPGCAVLEEMGSIQRMESMAYAVQAVNSWPDFLQNLTLGFRIFDTCNSESVALARTMDVLPHCANCTHYPICFPECPTIVSGVVGPESSSNTLLAAHACNLALTPIISYFATSVELTDQSVFPTLFTTVPSDDFQVSAMLALLEHFGWTYFSVVHTNDRYGKDALDYIQLNMDEMCLAAVAQVSSEGTDASFDTVVESLMVYKQQSDASVVIVFTDGRSANKLFEAVERANVIGEFIWIGSEGWGVSMNDISSMLHVAQGSVTFTPHTEIDPAFDEYFQNLPINHTANPWWKEIWATHFNCSFFVPSDDERSCLQYEHIDTTNGYVPDSTVSLVNDAVYAFAYAINDYVNKTNVTYGDNGKPLIPPWELIEYIRDISFPAASLRRTMSLGQVTALYDIKNLQVNEKEEYDYVNVGYWSTTKGLNLNENNIQWPGRKETTPKSFCSDQCLPGEIQVLLKISCCWDCEPCGEGAIVTNGTRCEFCNEFYWPNENFTTCDELELSFLHWDEPVAIILLTLASGVLLLMLLTSFYMIRHRNDRLVKASGTELMTIIMIGVIMQIGLTFAILAKPTSSTCFTIRFLFGLDVTITYSAILVKSNRIYRIFSSGLKSAKPPVWIKKYQQLLSASVIIFMQVLIVTVLCVVYPPKVVRYQPTRDVAELSCEIEEVTVLVPLAFNLLIIFPCLYYGWKTRSLPANYNESRYIAFTVCTTLVIWVAFIPIYLTVGTNQTTSSEIHVEILTTVELMSAFITLACFFFPKLYALKFVPTASWHVASTYKKRPNSSFLSQCEHCGSIYSGESKMGMQPINSRSTALVIHRSAQPTELNRFGRRRASSFAEAVTKIKIAQPERQPKPPQQVALSPFRHRSSSAPDIGIFLNDKRNKRPEFTRSKTDFNKQEVDELGQSSELEKQDGSSFYLHVATPLPSRRSSTASTRKTSVVTPVNLTPIETVPVAFQRKSTPPGYNHHPLIVKNGFLAAAAPHQPAKVNEKTPSPTIRHPNQVPGSPYLVNEGHSRHVSIAVPESCSVARDLGYSVGRERSSSDAAEKRKERLLNQRRRSSLVNIANVLSSIERPTSPDRPRPRVLAYTKVIKSSTS